MMDSSRLDVAKTLLETVSISDARREARRNQQWARAMHGFRADSLTRPLLVRSARVFAQDPALLRSLSTVFLDGLGAPASSDLRARFAHGAAMEGLPEHVKALCVLLSEQDAADLPLLRAEPEKANESTADTPPPTETGDLPPQAGRRRTARKVEEAD